MNAENKNVKQKLLEIGRKEFCEYGYDKASMRRVSAAAGVSTGAIYFFFQNKQDFFQGILDETAQELKKRIYSYAESEINGRNSSAMNDSALLEFLLEHKEEVRILFERSEGTIYENYKEELFEILEQSYAVFYKRFGGCQRDYDIVKIIVRMRMCGLSELIHGDYTMEEMMRYIKLLAFYGDSGFEGMMKQYNEQ